MENFLKGNFPSQFGSSAWNNLVEILQNSLEKKSVMMEICLSMKKKTLFSLAELLYPWSEKTAQFWAEGQSGHFFLVIIQVQVG